MLSRRGFVRLTAAGVGVAGLGVLAQACAPAAPTATSAARPAAAAPTGASSSTGLPAYVPFNGPPPDMPGTAAGIQPIYVHFPKNPVAAVSRPPASGGEITAVTSTIYAPPPALEQNPVWQEVNKRLGTNLKINVSSTADYAAKLNTVVAGDDLPDLLEAYQASTAAIPNILEFLQAKCEDLTPYLAGDAVKDYPFLANLPTYNWQGTGTTYNGHIWGIPIPRSILAYSLMVDQSALDQVGMDMPKTADDFKRALVAVNRPQDNVWGIGVSAGSGLLVPSLFTQIFNGPNNWRLDAGGKLTKDYETDELKAALGYARDLYAAGVFHPQSGTYSNTAADTDFVGGKFVFYRNPWLGLSTVYWPQAAKVRPAAKMRGVPPFSHDGSKPVYFLGTGNQGNTYLKKNSPDRVKEILRVMDYLAAPFGTQEQLLLTYGLPDQDYTLSDTGDPVTVQGGFSSHPVPWRYLTQYPAVQYNAVNPEAYAKIVRPVEEAMVANTVQDPTLTLYSPTYANLNITLSTMVNDALTDIVVGRRPLSDFDAVVKDWRDKGGEKIRSEYQTALAKA